MWSPSNFRSRKHCEHLNTQTSTSVGLRRRVCIDCGHVSFDDLADVIEEILEDIVTPAGLDDALEEILEEEDAQV